MQKGLILIIVGFLMVTIIAGGAFYLNRQTTPVPSPTPVVAPQTSQPTLIPSSTSNPVDKTANWKTYTNIQQGFTIKHPEEAEIKEGADGSTTLILSGPTQKRGADFYDGIFLRFKSNALKGKNIKQIADEELQKEKNAFDTYGHVTEDTKQFTLVGISGYSYTIANFGIHTVIYLPNKSGRYLDITNSTSDPTGKGFQKSADQILSTFKFL